MLSDGAQPVTVMTLPVLSVTAVTFVADALALLSMLGQFTAVPAVTCTVIVMLAPAANDVKLHGNVLLVSQVLLDATLVVMSVIVPFPLNVSVTTTRFAAEPPVFETTIV